ncbi:MAG: glycosyltransferase family 4 protein [Acidobacteriota bacterium]|nr:MAG: glycosyltransferase family 4 protein [Acidobacteriota bacterium]
MPVEAPSMAAPVGRLTGRRVVIVLESLRMGGAERQALLLARHLASREGAIVAVWGLGPLGELVSYCEQYGIRWRRVPRPVVSGRLKRWSRLAGFAWRLRRAGVDVLLPFTSVPNVSSSVVARWANARLCIWNQRDEGIGRLGGRLERFAARRADLFVANSESGARWLTNSFGVPDDQIQLVPNGVWLEAPRDSRSAWRERLGATASEFLVGMLANLHAAKDHETLLSAWRLVLDHWQCAESMPLLILAGREGDTAEMLRARAAQLELGDRTRFLGSVGDVAGLLSALDLLAHSARSESCSNAVLEAMAHGRPIVATDTAGTRVALGDDEQLVPPADPAALAERIRRLADDEPRRLRLGAANRKRAATCFSPDQMCETMTRIIADGLTTRRGASGATLGHHASGSTGR